MFVVLLLASCALAEDRKDEKPAAHALKNKAGDVHVVSDKDEAVLNYFRRHRLVVGSLGDKETAKVLEAKKPLDGVFFSYASHNDDPEKGSTFGATLKVAPLSK